MERPSATSYGSASSVCGRPRHCSRWACLTRHSSRTRRTRRRAEPARRRRAGSGSPRLGVTSSAGCRATAQRSRRDPDGRSPSPDGPRSCTRAARIARHPRRDADRRNLRRSPPCRSRRDRHRQRSIGLGRPRPAGVAPRPDQAMASSTADQSRGRNPDAVGCGRFPVGPSPRSCGRRRRAPPNRRPTPTKPPGQDRRIHRSPEAAQQRVPPHARRSPTAGSCPPRQRHGARAPPTSNTPLAEAIPPCHSPLDQPPGPRRGRPCRRRFTRDDDGSEQACDDRLRQQTMSMLRTAQSSRRRRPLRGAPISRAATR